MIQINCCLLIILSLFLNIFFIQDQHRRFNFRQSIFRKPIVRRSSDEGFSGRGSSFISGNEISGSGKAFMSLKPGVSKHGTNTHLLVTKTTEHLVPSNSQSAFADLFTFYSSYNFKLKSNSKSITHENRLNRNNSVLFATDNIALSLTQAILPYFELSSASTKRTTNSQRPSRFIPSSRTETRANRFFQSIMFISTTSPASSDASRSWMTAITNPNVRTLHSTGECCLI